MSPLLLAVVLALSSGEIDNPNIDMAAYLRVAQEAAVYRVDRRVSEDEFLRLACEPGAVILDARSSEKFREMHVKGAVNLSFPDITAASLRAAIPDLNAPVLIYCNNNFIGAERPFPSKASRASLNLSTFIALYSYGYRNIYELWAARRHRQVEADVRISSGQESSLRRLNPADRSTGLQAFCRKECDLTEKTREISR